MEPVLRLDLKPGCLAGHELMNDSPLENHFFAPKRVGSLPDFDLRVEEEDPTCGDLLVLTLRRRESDEGQVVDDVRFQAYGCPATIASGSALTSVLLDRSRDELERDGAAVLAKELGTFDAHDRHAAELAERVLEAIVSAW